MPILTESGLDRLSGWILRNVLKDDCQVMRNSPTQSSSGGMVAHWSQAGSVRKCAVLDAGGPSEQFEAAQQVGYITKTILFQRGEDIRGNDRLVVGPVTYSVIDIFEPSSYNVCTRVLARRASIQGGF